MIFTVLTFWTCAWKAWWLQFSFTRLASGNPIPVQQWIGLLKFSFFFHGVCFCLGCFFPPSKYFFFFFPLVPVAIFCSQLFPAGHCFQWNTEEGHWGVLGAIQLGHFFGKKFCTGVAGVSGFHHLNCQNFWALTTYSSFLISAMRLLQSINQKAAEGMYGVTEAQWLAELWEKRSASSFFFY